MLQRILIADDEPENVEALEAALRRSRIHFDSVSTLEEAAERIRTHTKRPYAAVVCDNHFSDEGCIYPTGTVDGIDFLNIIFP